MSSSQALEALNAKRKKIASELSDLETKVRSLCSCVTVGWKYSTTMSLRFGVGPYQNLIGTLKAYHKHPQNPTMQIYNLETSYIGQEDCSSFGTVLKVKLSVFL